MADNEGTHRTTPEWASEIRVARVRAGMKQHELASKLGVSQSTITAWETGKSRPPVAYWPLLEGMLSARVYKALTEDTGFIRGTHSGTRGSLVFENVLRYSQSVNAPFIDIAPKHQFGALYERTLQAIRGANLPVNLFDLVAEAFSIWMFVTSDKPPRMWETCFAEELEKLVAFRLEVQASNSANDKKPD